MHYTVMYRLNLRKFFGLARLAIFYNLCEKQNNEP